MPLISFTGEQIRAPLQSAETNLRIEDAAQCDGQCCGNYQEDGGKPLTPRLHSHLVVTGIDPNTTPRFVAIFK